MRTVLSLLMFAAFSAGAEVIEAETGVLTTGAAKIQDLAGASGGRIVRMTGKNVMKPEAVKPEIAQGVFAGDLGVEAGQKLPPCGKMLAAAVAGGLVGLFVETISGDELEKLLKDAIVKHCRFSYAHFKDFRHL